MFANWPESFQLPIGQWVSSEVITICILVFLFLADQIFYRSYVYRQHFRLRSFPSFRLFSIFGAVGLFRSDMLLIFNLSVSSFLIAATTRYSGLFLLSLVTYFACGIGQLAKIWIWVSSKVITICIQWVCEYQSNSWILHSLLHRAEETQQGRNSCPRLQFGFQFGLYRVVAPLSFLRSISLASLY